MRYRNHVVQLLVGFLLLVGLGCDQGPQLGKVSGKVLLPGGTAENFLIVFIPEAGGRPASAVIDANGSYVLNFSPSADGALVGTHFVTFEPNADDDEHRARLLKGFPKKYLSKSDLKATVTSGQNELNFTLEP